MTVFSRWRPALVSWALLFCATLACAQPPAVQPAAAQQAARPTVARAPEVAIPASMMIPAPPELAAQFPKGLMPGLGFGLNCAQGQPDGSMVLHTLTGRGPTAPGPTVSLDGRAAPSTLFVLPGFNPSIVTMKLSGNKAEVVGILPLKNGGGRPLTGLPPAPSVEGQPVSVPLDASLRRLGFDQGGLDPSGVSYDFKRGVFWVSDGYRPGLARVSPSTGEASVVLDAAEGGLQHYLATCRPGLGFSGASVSPGGKVFTVMRGVLSFGGRPGLFSRIVEYDPDSERVRQLAYPVEDIFEDPSRVVLGEPVAFGDKKLLVLEQGVDREGRSRNLVFSVDISRADNINRVFDEEGRPPEAMTDKALLRKNLNLARKTLVLDLKEAGFKEAWAESMTLLSDGQTLAFMGGHGFGLQQVIAGYATGPDGKPVLDPAAYTLMEGGALAFGGQRTWAAIGFKPGAEAPRLWLATLPRKVVEY